MADSGSRRRRHPPRSARPCALHARAHAPPARSPRRIAGVTVPLFSLRGASSWGIGEIGDLPAFAEWMREAGIRLVQLLPLGEISGGETSPYGALTAFGIDPIYLSLSAVPDLGGDVQAAVDRSRLHESQADSAYGALARARESRTVDYAAVRALKQHALRVAFDRFYEGEVLPRDAAGGGASARSVRRTRRGSPDYALFRALKDAAKGKAWWEWPAPLRERSPRALVGGAGRSTRARWSTTATCSGSRTRSGTTRGRGSARRASR